MKKIRVTSKQFAVISFSYRILGFLFIIGLLVIFAHLIGKPFEFVLIFLPYFVTKGLYSKQWHSNSMKQCMAISILTFALLTLVTIDDNYSILFSVIVGLSVAYCSYKVGVAKAKSDELDEIKSAKTKFCLDGCSEEELRERCRELNFSESNTELSVDLFIRKIPHKVIADKLNIQEKSVTMQKTRLKKKLEP